jgi:hypothetical protein
VAVLDVHPAQVVDGEAQGDQGLMDGLFE